MFSDLDFRGVVHTLLPTGMYIGISAKALRINTFRTTSVDGSATTKCRNSCPLLGVKDKNQPHGGGCVIWSSLRFTTDRWRDLVQ